MFEMQQPAQPARAAAQAPACRYQRTRDLPRLLPLFENDLVVVTLAQHEALVGRLRRALRRERCNGIAGHWTYDLGRHAALLAAYRFEQEAVTRRQQAAGE